MSIVKDTLDNPIVEKIPTNWEGYAEQFDHDLYRIYEDLKAKEEKWKSQGFEFIETILDLMEG